MAEFVFRFKKNVQLRKLRLKIETVHCFSPQPFFPKAFEIVVKAGLLVLLCFYRLPGFYTSGFVR